MRYCPFASDTAERTFSMSAGLAASTVTPGSTAPDVSRTTPAIDACANTVDGRTRNATSTVAARNTIFISGLRCSLGVGDTAVTRGRWMQVRRLSTWRRGTRADSIGGKLYRAGVSL